MFFLYSRSVTFEKKKKKRNIDERGKENSSIEKRLNERAAQELLVIRASMQHRIQFSEVIIILFREGENFHHHLTINTSSLKTLFEKLINTLQDDYSIRVSFETKNRLGGVHCDLG